QERLLVRDAGVVDEHVDPPERRGGGLDDRVDRGLVGHVPDDPLDRTGRQQRDERVLELRLLETGDEHARAFLEEPPRGREADPARAADDEHALPLEPSHQRTIPRAAIAISRSTAPSRTPYALSKRFTAEQTCSGITSSRSPIRSSASPTM